MYACPNCAATITDTRLATEGETCPRCGAASPQEDEPRWINVARVTNLAEAGYLTDELVGLGIDAQIHQMNEFSAITDRWDAQYLIRVPADAAGDAATRIREHLTDEAADYDQRPSAFRLMGGDQPMDPLLWRPVALVILAGVSSFVLGQRFSDMQEAKADRRPSRNSFAMAIEAIDRPFVTKSSGHEPQHRLQFDRRRQSWVLDTDGDGDGQYDSRQMYHESGASW
jgi:hypothetical protein